MSARELAIRLSEVIINPILALAFAVALLVFIFGIVRFIGGLSTESGDREKGKKHMLYGVIGMFIMVAAWAFLQIIGNTVGTPIRL